MSEKMLLSAQFLASIYWASMRYNIFSMIVSLFNNEHATKKITIVKTSLNDKTLAVNLAKQITKEHIAACVQITENLCSIYEYQGKQVQEKEFILEIKTHTDAAEALIKFIKQHHTYDIPEILSYPAYVKKEYYNWVEEKQRKLH